MPPVIRLIQADDLDAWQRVLLALCSPPERPSSASGVASPLDVPAMLVPSRGAAEQWRRTLEQRLLVEGWQPSRTLQQGLGHVVPAGARTALAMPRLLTRDELYDACHRAARLDLPRLPTLTREVLMGASARHAARTHRPPFQLRPGLIAEMVRLFDDVTRLGHDPLGWLEGSAALLADQAPADRGAERLLAQTRFLQEAFRRYESSLDEARGLDERALRDALRLSSAPWLPHHVIVTVADHHAQAEGLWPADLQLLSQAPGLERLDVVATRRLAESLYVRLRRGWPAAIDVRIPSQRASGTRLEVSSPERRWIACRDRDEEVLAYARRVKSLAPDTASSSALVYRRPLPYLYVAQYALEAAGIPFQTSGTLPLAAEPGAATLDLLMDAALSGFTRAALVTLLRSPHVQVRGADGVGVAAADIAAFDTWLARQRYLGTLEHLDQLIVRGAAAARDEATALAHGGGGRRAEERRQEGVARAVAEALRPILAPLAMLLTDAPGATHVGALRTAWHACERAPEDDDPCVSRTRRTRASIDMLLGRLESTLRAHDDMPVPPRDTCILVRRWIEERTFALPRPDEGVQLVDADAAPYGLFDHVRLVGLLEGEWPEPSARNIFYPAFMLERLGWAEEHTRTAALRARLADLLTLPTAIVGESVPELDQDAVVRPSSLLDELHAFVDDRLLAIPHDTLSLPVTREDALLATPAVPHAPVLDAEAQAWAAWRLGRPAPATAGQTAPAPGDRYGVTAVETYLQCPFQYFAGRVLGLREELDDEVGLPAREAGLFLHGVLHDCYEEWRHLGRTAMRAVDLADARAVFTRVAERALQRLPPADRAVEHVRLFGSAVATGALEKALRVEVEAFGDVKQRLLEHDIDDEVELPSVEGTRRVRLRGRVDRADFTNDGRVRVVDYKIGRRPAQALQPGVYVQAIVQQERRQGRERGVAPSGFIAFREDAPWIAAVPNEEAADKEARSFVSAVERIESGEFPVRPQNEFRCQFCDYAGVCRKDYVGDE